MNSTGVAIKTSTFVLMVVLSLLSLANAHVEPLSIQSDPKQAFSEDENKTWQLLYQFPELLQDGRVLEAAQDVDPQKAQFALDAAARKNLLVASTTTALLERGERQGACDPALCGDGLLCPSEQCDDGNVVNNDGCSSLCEVEQRTPAVCGDGFVSFGEECEFPSTADSVFCHQQEQQCQGNQLLTRDSYGNCRLDCQCTQDPYVASCVVGQCGASCGSNADCPSSMVCNQDTCSCQAPVGSVCGNGIQELGEECDTVALITNSSQATCGVHFQCVSCKLVQVDQSVYARAEVCDGVDNDCNGEIDDINPSLCVNQDSLCENQLGVCFGSQKTCSGANGYEMCGAQEYDHTGHYEFVEETCDNLDNDCDGSVDEGCGCVEDQPCGPQRGLCQAGVQRCDNEILLECEGAVFPSTEICDGLDNDCDGATDECVTNSCGKCATEPYEVCNYKDDNCNAEPLSPTRGVFNFSSQQYTRFSHYCAPGVLCQGALADGIDNDGDGVIDEGIDEGVRWQDSPQWCNVCYDTSKTVETGQELTGTGSTAHDNTQGLFNSLLERSGGTPLLEEYDTIEFDEKVTGKKAREYSNDIACCAPNHCIYSGECYAPGTRLDANDDGTVDQCKQGQFLAEEQALPNRLERRMIIQPVAYAINERARKADCEPTCDPAIPDTFFSQPGPERNRTQTILREFLWSEEHDAIIVASVLAVRDGYGIQNLGDEARFTLVVHNYDLDGQLRWKSDFTSPSYGQNFDKTKRYYEVPVPSHLSISPDGNITVAGYMTQHQFVSLRPHQYVTRLFEFTFSNGPTPTIKEHEVNDVLIPAPFGKTGAVTEFNEGYLYSFSRGTEWGSVPKTVLIHWNPRQGVQWQKTIDNIDVVDFVITGDQEFHLIDWTSEQSATRNPLIGLHDFIYESGITINVSGQAQRNQFARIHRLSAQGDYYGSQPLDLGQEAGIQQPAHELYLIGQDGSGLYFMRESEDSGQQPVIVKTSYDGTFVYEVDTADLTRQQAGSKTGRSPKTAYVNREHIVIGAYEQLLFVDKASQQLAYHLDLQGVNERGIGEYNTDLIWIQPTKQGVVAVYDDRSEHNTDLLQILNKLVVDHYSSTPLQQEHISSAETLTYVAPPVHSSSVEYHSIGVSNKDQFNHALFFEEFSRADKVESRADHIVAAAVLTTPPSDAPATPVNQPNTPFLGRVSLVKSGSTTKPTFSSTQQGYALTEVDVELFEGGGHVLFRSSVDKAPIQSRLYPAIGHHWSLLEIEPVSVVYHSQEFNYKGLLPHSSQEYTMPLLEGTSMVGHKGDLVTRIRETSTLPLIYVRNSSDVNKPQQWFFHSRAKDDFFVYRALTDTNPLITKVICHQHECNRKPLRSGVALSGQAQQDQYVASQQAINRASNKKLQVFTKQGLKLVEEIDLGTVALARDYGSLSAHNGRVSYISNNTLHFISFGKPVWTVQLPQLPFIPVSHVGNRGVYTVELQGEKNLYLTQFNYGGEAIATTQLPLPTEAQDAFDIWVTALAETPQGASYILYVGYRENGKEVYAKYHGVVTSFVHGNEQGVTAPASDVQFITRSQQCDVACSDYTGSFACQQDNCPTQDCQWSGSQSQCFDIATINQQSPEGLTLLERLGIVDTPTKCVDSCAVFSTEHTCHTAHLGNDDCVGRLCQWEERSLECIDPAEIVCGNGRVEPGEDCDSGGVTTATCSSNCEEVLDLTKISLSLNKKEVRSGGQVIVQGTIFEGSPITSLMMRIRTNNREMVVGQGEVNGDFTNWVIDTTGLEPQTVDVGVILMKGNTIAYQSPYIRSFDVLPNPYRLKILAIPVRSSQTPTAFKANVEQSLLHFISNIDLNSCKERVLVEFPENINYERKSAQDRCEDTLNDLWYYVQEKGYSPLDYHAVVAMTDEPGNPCQIPGVVSLSGVAYGLGSQNNVVLSNFESPNTLSHELGHRFGLHEEYCSQDAGGSRLCSSARPDVPNPLSTKYSCDSLYYDHRSADRTLFKIRNQRLSADPQDCCFTECSGSGFCCLGNRNALQEYSIMASSEVHRVADGASSNYVFHPEVRDYLNQFHELNCNE